MENADVDGTQYSNQNMWRHPSITSVVSPEPRQSMSLTLSTILRARTAIFEAKVDRCYMLVNSGVFLGNPRDWPCRFLREAYLQGLSSYRCDLKYYYCCCCCRLMVGPKV